ncbi:c-type cytochrome biogenesis protein CcsB [Pelotalea chapellei]|uniref:C-type cytochrome biogenesis protein CcsB n=1 Tax=Pelotalea chapellei TaxID=44671 RepID=A0ABS5U557_9BACT|nr:c-type cytochrome biogenesis protein CcsB [Pelotalea chapellei]MBT1070801.1 c-type cytochrome biogenesis protein CcsB [Pelotalea chapellei]
MTHFFFSLTLGLYVCATAAYLGCLFKVSTKLTQWATRLLGIGFIAHILSTIHLANQVKHLPLTDMQGALSFFSLMIIGAFLFFERKYKVTTLGSFVTPVALLMLIVSSALHGGARQLPPILQSNWFWFHALLAFASYAAFAIACGVAVMYLLQRSLLKKKHFNGLFQKLPPLETLDEISYRCLAIGFPLLTVAIISGAIWSEKAIGNYWEWDPKQTWSLITWLIYAALLHGRLTIGWRGKRAAILSIIGFVVLLVTFFGMKHSITW